MNIKSGVRISGVQPEIVLALLIADGVYQDHGEVLTVTSLLDGKHMRASLHYVGSAGDLRLPVQGVDPIVLALRSALGENYDVVLESDHIHIEYQPKHGA